MEKKPTRTPMYSQIIDYLKNYIQVNKLNAHNRLPSENELAAQFNVSRITIKKALDDLAESGSVYRIQGKGSFVSEGHGAPVLYPPARKAAQDLIALLMPRLCNRFTMNLLNGIEEELAQNGYFLIFAKTYDSQDLEKTAIANVLEAGVKGLIIFPVEGETYNEELVRAAYSRLPLVLVDRYMRGIDMNAVCSDNVQGAYEAVSHLIGLGHTRIGVFSTRSQGTTTIEERLAGYEKALADHRLPLDYDLRLDHFDNEKMNAVEEEFAADPEYKEEIKQFLLRHPDMTAIFAINPAVGMTLVAAAAELGLAIPEQLSVVCYDKDSHAFTGTALTYVDQDERRMGQEAAKLVIDLIQTGRRDKSKLRLPPRLVVRQSTAPPGR